jgi:hypothetical protein
MIFGGCQPGYICCQPNDPTKTVSGTAGTAGTSGNSTSSGTPVTTPKPLATPGSPTIQLYQAGTTIAAAKEVTAIPGSSMPDPSFKVVERIGYHDCSVVKNATICASKITIQAILRNARGDVVDAYATNLETAKFEVSGIPTTVTRKMLTVSAITKTPTPDPKNPELIYTTIEFTITPDFTTKDAGQRYQLQVEIIPDPAMNKPALAKQQSVNFNVLNPVKISGVSPQITKKKEITVSCDSSIKCENMYFKLVDNPDRNPDQCNNPGDLSQIKTLSYDTKYCRVDFTTNTPACNYNTQAECDASLGSAQDSRWLTAAQYASKSFDQGGDLMLAGQQLFGAGSSVNIPVCIAKTIPRTGTGPFKIASYTPQSLKGTITLDYDAAKGKYLCVYGADAQGKAYWSASQQEILLDLQPPTLTAKFDPLTLVAKATCTDDVGGSGCKTTIGYTYISDLASYSQALFRGPKSAALYCPPFQMQGSYTSSPYYTINTANSNEVRVMCIRAEDNAGNAAVTMITTFNSYDLLAKSVAMAMRR